MKLVCAMLQETKLTIERRGNRHPHFTLTSHLISASEAVFPQQNVINNFYMILVPAYCRSFPYPCKHYPVNCFLSRDQDMAADLGAEFELLKQGLRKLVADSAQRLQVPAYSVAPDDEKSAVTAHRATLDGLRQGLDAYLAEFEAKLRPVLGTTPATDGSSICTWMSRRSIQSVRY